MNASSSAPGLSQKVSTIQKPRSLVKARGSDQSRSSPALAAAFSLRKYAVEAKHIPPPRPHTAPPGAATFGMSAMAKPIRPEDLDRIDLLGGNGSWRQVLAEEEFERRRLADEETARQARTKVLEKKRKESEREAKLAAHARAEEKRFQADREQKRLNQLAAEQSQREAAESKRVQREFEMEERRRRMPKTCETCAGSA